MRLTLLRAKEALRRFSPAAELDYRINRVCERFLTDAKFNGTIQQIAVAAPYGQLTLPRQFRSVEGVNMDGFVPDIGNQWFDFMPGPCNSSCYSMGAVRDLGDGHAVRYTPRISEDEPLAYNTPANQIPENGTLQSDYTGVGSMLVTIYGTDTEGMPLTLELVDKDPVANPFARITRIHKEIGTLAVRVTYTTDDAIETDIALMEPSEEESFYRRYMISAYNTCAEATVAALAKLRHIEFTGDNDILPFSNIGALENGMNAINFEKENDTATADNYWGKGIKILNDELKVSTGAVTVPPIRFKYPRGCAPRLSFHL